MAYIRQHPVQLHLRVRAPQRDIQDLALFVATPELPVLEEIRGRVEFDALGEATNDDQVLITVVEFKLGDCVLGGCWDWRDAVVGWL